MVQVMLLGGLRRCEVLGLRLPDLHPGERRVFVAEGKGGHQRIVPVSARFFSASRHTTKPSGHEPAARQGLRCPPRPGRGQPLTAAGLDEIVDGAKNRAGLHI